MDEYDRERAKHQVSHCIEVVFKNKKLTHPRPGKGRRTCTTSTTSTARVLTSTILTPMGLRTASTTRLLHRNPLLEHKTLADLVHSDLALLLQSACESRP